MSSNFSLKAAETIGEWDAFLGRSKCDNCFLYGDFLEASGAKFQNFFIKKNDQSVLGCSLVLDASDERRGILDDLVVYNGLVLTMPENRQSYCQKNSNDFSAIEACIPLLFEKFHTVNMRLDPSVQDLRPFQWFNYGIRDARRFACDIRYTSILNIENINVEIGEETLLRGLGSSRRQEIRYAMRDGVRAQRLKDPACLTGLYRRTMESRSSIVDERYVCRMNAVMERHINNGTGDLFGVVDVNGVVISAAFFSRRFEKACYVFGASHPQQKNRYAGTILLWDAFKDLAGNGIKLIDFEGVNSPNRGWFKLSFGGILVPYYQVSCSMV